MQSVAARGEDVKLSKKRIGSKSGGGGANTRQKQDKREMYSLDLRHETFPSLNDLGEPVSSIAGKNPKQDTVGNGAFIERSPLKPLNYILLELPSKVEYALLALMEMASQADGKIPITVNEITAKHPIPERYLEQILANLRRGGLLKSQRGAKGGYILAKAPEEITILDVVTSIEGDREAPGLSDDTTIEMKLIRETWQKANLAAQTILGQHTLKSLCSEREAYLQKGLMYYI